MGEERQLHTFNLWMTRFYLPLHGGNKKRILRCFQIVSGLKINLPKSFLVGVGFPEEFIKILADRLHCKTGRLPCQYLDLPIEANPKILSMWDPVVEKFEKKLSTWKRQYLSFGGRITLIKSSLSSLSIYYMSLYKMPTAVMKKLDGIR